MEIPKRVTYAYRAAMITKECCYLGTHEVELADALRDMTALWMEMTFWDKHKFNQHGCANCSWDRYCIDPGHTWTPADWQAVAHKALMEE